MSIEYLLEAVRDTLVAEMDLDPNECDVQPEGHPPETMGDWYLSIDEGQIQSTDKGMLNEVYTVQVFVTLRAGIYPRDRLAEAYDRNRGLFLAGRQSLTALERSVIVAVHGSEALRVLACNKLGISTAAMFARHTVGGESVIDQTARDAAPGGDGQVGQAFQWPLWYQGRGPTQTKGAEWIGATTDDTFMVRTLPFTGGRRVQSLSTMK